MARTKIDNPEFTLEEYASKYAKAKAEEKKLKKEVETLNERVKELMKSQDRTEVPVGNVIVHYSTRTSESFNEEKLITQLKHFAPESNCIKTKEYVDMEILEGEIYRGILSTDALLALDACKVSKVTDVLTITKKK